MMVLYGYYVYNIYIYTYMMIYIVPRTYVYVFFSVNDWLQSFC